MKLEQQVCSLELAKRLKELGMKQESLFYWQASDLEYRGVWGHPSEDASKRLEQKELDEFMRSTFSAFTVAELGEMLPRTLPEASHDTHLLQTWETKREHWCDCKLCDRRSERNVIHLSYWNGGLDTSFSDSDTEVEARAKLLIYLLESTLIALP